MSARIVTAQPHVLIRKGLASFHAAVPVTLAGVGPLMGGPVTYRTACGEDLTADDAAVEVWRGEAAAYVLQRAVEDYPAKVCKRCDRVGHSLGEAK